MRQYRREEATIEDEDEYQTTTVEKSASSRIRDDNMDSSRRTTSSSDGRSSSSSSSTTTTNNNNNVSFGTVTLREYERKLNVQADVDLGLTIGWAFWQHPPIDVDDFFTTTPTRRRRRNNDEYREAEPTSEGERAELLLESGYSKRQLRSAIKRRHRQMDYDDDDDESGGGSRRRIPQVLLSGPGRIFQNLSRGANRLWPSTMMAADEATFY